MTDKNVNLTDNSKRKFLRGLSLVIGGVGASGLLTGNAMSVAMAFTPSSTEITQAGKILSVSELKLLKQVCDVIIPATETASAGDVDTHGFIDNQLFHCFDKAKHSQVKSVLALIEKSSQASYKVPFLKSLDAQQFELLSNLDEGKGDFNQADRANFKAVKELVCFGYYTSEVGASQELRFDAVPGGYKGSVAYKKSDAAWGSSGLWY